MYRRSFHSDRDFRCVLHNFDFDQIVPGEKACPVNNGLEAPRNSLDIPSEAIDFRMKASTGYSVPFGYELRRSLTTRITSEEMGLELPEMTRVSEGRCKAPSLVARLMGLDAFPDGTSGINKKIGDGESLTCQSSRHHIPEDKPSANPGVAKMHFQGYSANASDERMRPRVLEHPQEKRLQEFKRDIASRQALGSRSSPLVESGKRGLVQATQLSAREKPVASEQANEAGEFLDALEFLHSNKDFFMKVLHDPHSLLAPRRIQHSCSLERHEGHAPFTTSRGPKESRKQGTGCNDSGAEFNRSTHQPTRNRSAQSSDWRSPQRPMFQPNEDMPLHMHRCCRQRSFRGSSLEDAQSPSRIVILKANPTKAHSSAKSSLPLGISPTVNCKLLRDECQELDRVTLQDQEQRLRSCRGDSKKDSHIRKEATRRQRADGPRDSRDIAREIVRQVKNSVDRKSKSVSSCGGASNARADSSRKVSPQKLLINASTGVMSDGEGYSAASRRPRGQSMKPYSSLPSSPRLDKDFNSELLPSSMGSEERLFALDDLKSGKDYNMNPMNKNDVPDHSKRNSGHRLRDSAAQGCMHQSKGSFKSLGCNGGGEISLRLRKPTHYPENTSNTTCFDPKRGAPRHLPRSYSVPDRRNFREQADGIAKHKLADASPLAGKISSLKNSLSLIKKSRRRTMGAQAEPPSCVDSVISEAAAETATPRCLFPAAQKCQSSEPTAFDEWSMKGSGGVLSEQHTALVSSPEHVRRKSAELGLRSATGGRDDDVRISVDFRGRGSATDTADTVDSCSDTSLEKAEQPSPVSVLEPPFREESPSPVDIQEGITNSELQLKLYILHLDGAEARPRSSGVGGNAPGTALAEPTQQASCDGVGAGREEKPWRLCEELCKPSLCFGGHGIPCPSGSEADVLYIRDVLVCSRLARRDTALVKSFSANHGLDPSIFLRVECQYRRKSRSKALALSIDGTRSQVLPDAGRRRLIFDLVDEIILTKLGMPADHQPWVRRDTPHSQFMWTGRVLIERVWAEVKKYFSLGNESQGDTLEDLASKAVSKGGSWPINRSDRETVCSEMEERILRTLVEEAVLELLCL